MFGYVCFSVAHAVAGSEVESAEAEAPATKAESVNTGTIIVSFSEKVLRMRNYSQDVI
jgi:hypothetical protein